MSLASSTSAPVRPIQQPSASNIEIIVARTLDDIQRVAVVRAAVYMTEQSCPYEEEFDGNDFCGTHLLGYVDGEPAACMRLRYFADFCKLERLAVRKEFRQTRVAARIIRAAIEHARLKGYRQVYGHVREGLTRFWSAFGAQPLGHDRQLEFSDHAYTEMVIDLAPHPEGLSLDAGAHVLNRPEGDWDRPGILEASSERSRSASATDRRAA